MEISTIGLDLGKNVFQIHAIDATGEVVVRKTMQRAQLLSFFEKLPPCLVGAKAGGTSHHWACELMKLGHTVRLMPPVYVKPYVKRDKNDAADAEAICEADRRPMMRFVCVICGWPPRCKHKMMNWHKVGYSRLSEIKRPKRMFVRSRR